MTATNYLRRSLWLPVFVPFVLLAAGWLEQTACRLLAEWSGGAYGGDGPVGAVLLVVGGLLLAALIVGGIPYAVHLSLKWKQFEAAQSEEVSRLVVAAPLGTAAVGTWFYGGLGAVFGLIFGGPGGAGAALLFAVYLLAIVLVVGYAYVGLAHAALFFARAYGKVE